MARPPTMVIQDDYIDMDLTPAATPVPPPSSPRFEFQSAGAGDARHREAAFASPADELFYKGNLLPLHLPPRLQLVQRLLQDQEQQQPPLRGVKRDAESDAAAAAAAEGGDADAASKVCAAKKPSWAKKLKVVKRWASREYIRSLFLARPPLPSDIVAAADGGTSASASGHGIGSVSARGSVLEQEEACQCHHRKSFSGIIRRVRLVATNNKAPGTSPLCSSSSSSSSSTPSCGNANGFFFRTPAPALKRSSSSGSSEEGAIQGAIAHCKRSQLLQPGMMVSSAAAAAARRSVSDVMFYSVTNTPRASSVAAGEVAQERRQEMCRG
ncbi:probable membrane-associated kinase regulator 3 [Miscanthus floridulus]|uniref:probable membrane-associated kinase regulator 3 n=1 Tax=Miscanthus floridulus TaxID=154761 RepID=UPI0034599C44